MYTSSLNYGEPEKSHRANGFTTDSGFAEYAVNQINTLARVPDTMSDAEATLVVTAGTSMYGLTELGGLVAGESVVVIGPRGRSDYSQWPLRRRSAPARSS
jgi:L-iditol 2-dehydrogenase